MIKSWKSRLVRVASTAVALSGVAGCAQISGHSGQVTQPMVFQDKRGAMVAAQPAVPAAAGVRPGFRSNY